MSQQITKEMTIAEVLRKNPQTAHVFMRHGMQCLGCAGATGESVERAAAGHGINLETLLKELNEV